MRIPLKFFEIPLNLPWDPHQAPLNPSSILKLPWKKTFKHLQITCMTRLQFHWNLLENSCWGLGHLTKQVCSISQDTRKGFPSLFLSLKLISICKSYRQNRRVTECVSGKDHLGGQLKATQGMCLQLQISMNRNSSISETDFVLQISQPSKITQKEGSALKFHFCQNPNSTTPQLNLT